MKNWPSKARRGLGGLVWASPNSRGWTRWPLGAKLQPSHPSLAPWSSAACPYPLPPHQGPEGNSLQKREAQAGRAHLSAPAQALSTSSSFSPHLCTASTFKATVLFIHTSTLKATRACDAGRGAYSCPRIPSLYRGKDFRSEPWSVKLQSSHTLSNAPGISRTDRCFLVADGLND